VSLRILGLVFKCLLVATFAIPIDEPTVELALLAVLFGVVPGTPYIYTIYTYIYIGTRSAQS